MRRSHEWIDRRSLALHEAVAAKLEADPTLLEVARTNLSRWLQVSPAATLLEWRDLLQVKSVPQVIALLRGSSACPSIGPSWTYCADALPA